MTDISSRTRRRFRLIGRLPALCGDHYGSEPETEIGLNLQAAHSLGDDLPAVRAFRQRPLPWLGPDELPRSGQRLGAHGPCGAVPVHFDFRAEFVPEHCERDPGLLAESGQDIPLVALVVAAPFSAHVSTCDNSADLVRIVGHRGGEQIGRARRDCRRIHGRIRTWRRLFRARKNSSRHARIPRPHSGRTGCSMVSPHTTPIAGPFPRDFANRENVPGPLPEHDGRGPGTRALCPGGTPPNSRGKGAHLRYVARRVGSGYVRRGAYDTRGLSSCLVNSTAFYAIAQRVCE